MMSLLNSWDLKRINSAVVVGGTRHSAMGEYVGDGRRADAHQRRARGLQQSVHRQVMPDAIDFVLHSRPHFLAAVDVANCRDARRWNRSPGHPAPMCNGGAQALLTPANAQIRDSFRAAGFEARTSNVQPGDAPPDCRTGCVVG
jgi:hypothetical protein